MHVEESLTLLEGDLVQGIIAAFYKAPLVRITVCLGKFVKKRKGRKTAFSYDFCIAALRLSTNDSEYCVFSFVGQCSRPQRSG